MTISYTPSNTAHDTPLGVWCSTKQSEVMAFISSTIGDDRQISVSYHGTIYSNFICLLGMVADHLGRIQIACHNNIESVAKYDLLDGYYSLKQDQLELSLTSIRIFGAPVINEVFGTKFVIIGRPGMYAPADFTEQDTRFYRCEQSTDEAIQYSQDHSAEDL